MMISPFRGLGMIHIVFQQADVDVLKQAMELDETLQGEIFEIKDEWGVGPLQELDTEEGCQARADWWRELLKDSPYGVTDKPSRNWIEVSNSRYGIKRSAVECHG